MLSPRLLLLLLLLPLLLRNAADSIALATGLSSERLCDG
jgi:hypothetical protein